MNFVIVGNGVAGTEAALALRKRAPDATITIVSEESDHFFSRTALMYVAIGQLAHKDIEPLERDVYARMNFVRVRARAVGLDRAGKQLLLAGGLPPLPYDKLLIAAGSSARPAPWNDADTILGIGHLVTLQDLHWFTRELHGDEGYDQPERPWQHLANSSDDSPYRKRPTAQEARGTPTKRPVVVGGGLIGIEAIEVLCAKGLKPVFLIREDSFWPIALDPQEASWIAKELGHHGVDVRLQTNITALHADDKGCLNRLSTDHGDIDCDLLMVAIGVQAQTAWLADSGLELQEQGGAIVVNEHLQTSDPNVYAAGDCAAVRWFNDWVRPEQLWYTGRDQGRVAAKSLMGDNATYTRGTWYNSAKLMDIEYTTAGLVNMRVDGEENWLHEETGAVRSTTRFVSKDGMLIGFNALGRRWDHSILVRWIEERRPLPWVKAHLHEARFDTEFVPPLVLPA
jgi:NADPH-dependent 2,4-dienoyl-CoA reductase/sulfur reductase-like enzyme